MKSKTLKSLKKQLFKSRTFADEYIKKDLTLDIGQMLFEARIARGMTQEQLAKKIGTHQATIARLESGKGKFIPTLTMIEKIAEELNMTFVITV